MFVDIQDFIFYSDHAALVLLSCKIFRWKRTSDHDSLFRTWVHGSCFNFFEILCFFVQLIFQMVRKRVYLCSKFISNNVKVNLTKFVLNFCDHSFNFWQNFIKFFLAFFQNIDRGISTWSIFIILKFLFSKHFQNSTII